MSELDSLGNTGTGVPFLIGGMYVLTAVAAYCSSPQTTEINIDKRGDTLMKWVYFGAFQSVIFIGIAAIVDKKHRTTLIAGGALQLLFMFGAYVYAKQSGLNNNQQGTEQ